MTQPPNDAPVYALFGATGGLGSSLCRRLTESGARLVISARNQEKVEALAQEIQASHQVVDATDPEAVEAFLNGAAEQQGRLDGVVNCAGSLLLKPAHLTSPDEFRQTIETNLYSSFNIVRSAVKLMQKNKGGSIVLVSSVAARVGLASHEAIAAAKAGVEGLTIATAASYASKGVRVNAIAPGLVRSPMTEKQVLGNETGQKVAEKMHPLGRVGTPEDLTPLIQWLLDPATSWVTGQVFSVDGGMSTVRPRVSA